MYRIRIRWLVLAMFAAIMLIALPALAQEVAEEEEVISVGRVIGGLAVFGVIVKTAIQVTRGIITQLHGPIVAGLAAVYGIIIAGVLDFRAAEALLTQAGVEDIIGRTPSQPLDWVITGFAIAAVAGFLAEFVGISGPRAEANRTYASTTEKGHPGYGESGPTGHEHTADCGHNTGHTEGGHPPVSE